MRCFVDPCRKAGSSNHRRWPLGDSKVLKATAKGLALCFKSSKYTNARDMELIALLYNILQKARTESLMSIENDVEAPHDSALLGIVFQTAFLRTRRGGPARAGVVHRGVGLAERKLSRGRLAAWPVLSNEV